MPSVPLPFVVAVFLLIFIARLARRDEVAPANRAFVLLLAVCALQSVLIGLRWGYGVAAVGHVAPVVAATIPPLVFASFAGLARSGRAVDALWPHALPAAIVILLLALWRGAVDLALIALYLGYAAALLRLAWIGPDALGAARLESAGLAHRALVLAAAVLVGSAIVDLLVVLDLDWTRGEHTAAIVGTANLLSLLLLGFAGMVAGRTRPPPDRVEPAAGAPAAADEDVEVVVAKIDDLLRREELFRDADLNLNRLARRAALPARRISAAINRLHGKNVSQYINGYRIAEACRLLTGTDQSVTRIMFEAGFQTKSNFNREFRRVTGMSPLAWRQGARPGGQPPDAP